MAWINQAAHQTIPANSNLRIYSLQGNFLSSVSGDRPVQIQVTPLRDTKSFSTRFVMLSQEVDGKVKNCASAIADFYNAGDKTTLVYSSKPMRSSVTHHSKLEPTNQLIEKQVQEGIVHRKLSEMYIKSYSPFRFYTTTIPTPESATYHNLQGWNFKRPIGQEDLALTERTIYDWIKPNFNLQEITTSSSRRNSALSTSWLCYALDSMVAHSPLVLSQRFVQHVSDLSSLDFSIRFHDNNEGSDLSEYLLRQVNTVVGNHEKQFSQGQIFNEGEDGELSLVASITQTCILRGKEGKDGKVRLEKL